MDWSGDFVITWSNYDPTNGLNIYAQRYDTSGTPQGSNFKVNTNTSGRQIAPAVAMDGGGDFVIAWTGYNTDGGASDYNVYAQRYNAAGSTVGSEFRVNSYTTNLQRLQTLAFDAAGDFLIVWSSNVQDGSSYGVFGQFYKSDGTGTGEFQINTFTTSTQWRQVVASDYDGNFVVTWNSNGQDGNNYGVFARPIERTYLGESDSAGLVTAL